MTDAKRLAEIGARCELATKGPWDKRAIDVMREVDADFIAHAREDVPWLLGQITTDAGKPESEVIAAAERYEDYDHQYSELDPENPWYGHYKEILLEDRAKAKKDLCAAVKRLREGSGGTAAAPEEGGGE